ncbi:hypothetical protein KAFR_0A05460 [Kazachstania africana CBS 2517]|uniref:PH domain-containing protein n=1 Tax=Kazachstania africana (strain ATCC 22294 / BCRC 22015 / CBS 2517 / CECT 1963 / NBRC 1671 / NRRL Y-8276) TaxID=1071382 RepID=H2ANN1_KAZAF|nr:hypothetical protein KAFR_0A05460 [Kazachstania africana CBS 2517]CCF55981.1 hypothetical protein KAFR_0A05460 [Kazachstania africana CBS 2517]
MITSVTLPRERRSQSSDTAIADVDDQATPRSVLPIDTSQFSLHTSLQEDPIVSHETLPDATGKVTTASEMKMPLYVSVPIPKESGIPNAAVTASDNAEPYHESAFVKEYPTDILVDRFQKWKKILKSLSSYLKEVAYAEEQMGRINTRLRNEVKFGFLTDLEEGSNKLNDPLLNKRLVKLPQRVPPAQQNVPQEQEAASTSSPDTTVVEDDGSGSAFSGFQTFGSGSIQDIQVILKKYHVSMAHQHFKVSKELLNNVVPKLESMKKELSHKIKEIKGLHNDFASNLDYMLPITSNLLNNFISSIKTYKDGDEDPFILNLQLQIQLRRQIMEENYLKDAFINLQQSGMQLEKIIFSMIQNVLTTYSALLDSEARLVIKNLCHELQHSILSQAPTTEWNHFVSHHPTCLLAWKSYETIPTKRNIRDIIYPNMKHPLSKCVRKGYLQKADDSERHYYVLTATYLHVFSNDKFWNGGGLVQDKLASENDLKKQSILKPQVSLPLLNCKIVDITEDQFAIVGDAKFNNIDALIIKPRSASVSSTSSQTNKIISNVLKGSSRRDLPSSADPHQKNLEFQQSIKWVFKRSDNKECFNKWLHDISKLISFSDTDERINYVKGHLHNHSSPGSSDSDKLRTPLPSPTAEHPSFNDAFKKEAWVTTANMASNEESIDPKCSHVESTVKDPAVPMKTVERTRNGSVETVPTKTFPIVKTETGKRNSFNLGSLGRRISDNRVPLAKVDKDSDKDNELSLKLTHSIYS